jgi:hypothetical protein
VVNKKALEDQISRLLRLPYAPSEARDAKELRGEFRSVLVNCSSDAHLVAVVDSLVRTRQNDGRGGEIARVPAPADVHAAMSQVCPPEHAKAPSSCGKCAGGFIQLERMMKIGGLEAARYPFADYCECALGEFLRAGHRRHTEERMEKAHR